jgi:hypothetical protein
MSERTAEQIARDVAAKYLKRPPLAVTPKSPQDDTPPASEIPEHVSAPPNASGYRAGQDGDIRNAVCLARS